MTTMAPRTLPALTRASETRSGPSAQMSICLSCSENIMPSATFGRSARHVGTPGAGCGEYGVRCRFTEFGVTSFRRTGAGVAHGVGDVRKIPGVVDDVIDGLAQLVHHLALDRRLVRHVHTRDDLAPERVEVGRAAAADHHRLGSLRHELAHDCEAKPLVAAGHEHALALEVGAVVHRVDVQVPAVVLLLCTREPGHLVGEGEHALVGGAHRRGLRSHSADTAATA
mmetsp:Transcript_24275/g.71970  ORF Transcript_24275/g.71970 Transcript_24275/m.71970 type:complete len:226 (+) Transcript_24275:489-1166(+)